MILALVAASLITSLTVIATRSGAVRIGTNRTKFGVVVDGVYGIVPWKSQVKLLDPSWERSVVGTRSTVHSRRRDDWCGNANPSLGRVFAPSADWLMTFNNQSCSYDAPLGKKSSPKSWRDYISEHYLPGLTAFLQDNRSLLAARGARDAIEIWNEENCAANGSYIPPDIYASMLVRAASLIATWDRVHHSGLRTVMGGLCNPLGEVDGYSQYTSTVFAAGGAGLRTVAAIGIHPSYGTIEPEVWDEEIAFYRRLVQSYAAVGGEHQVWVTEVGSTGELGARGSQATFAQVLFSTLKADQVPVVIWYGIDDRMEGEGGYGGWGLFDKCGLLKPSGAVFQEFARGMPHQPSAGSTTRLRLAAVYPSRQVIQVRVTATVTCPSGSESPWTSFTLIRRTTSWDALVSTLRLTEPYHAGGSHFTLPLIPGVNTVAARYAGDYQLEDGRSNPVLLNLYACAGPRSAQNSSSPTCPSSVAWATSRAQAFCSDPNSGCGRASTPGDVLAFRGFFVVFYRGGAIVVGRRVFKVPPGTSLAQAMYGRWTSPKPPTTRPVDPRLHTWRWRDLWRWSQGFD